MNYPKIWIALFLILFQSFANATLVKEKIAIGEVTEESREFIVKCLEKVGKEGRTLLLDKGQQEEMVLEELVGKVTIYEKLLLDGSKTTRVEYTIGGMSVSRELNELDPNQRIVTEEEAKEILAMQENAIPKNQHNEDKKYAEPLKVEGELIGMATIPFKLVDPSYVPLADEFVFPASFQIIE